MFGHPKFTCENMTCGFVPWFQLDIVNMQLNVHYTVIFTVFRTISLSHVSLGLLCVIFSSEAIPSLSNNEHHLPYLCFGIIVLNGKLSAH